MEIFLLDQHLLVCHSNKIICFLKLKNIVSEIGNPPPSHHRWFVYLYLMQPTIHIFLAIFDRIGNAHVIP